VPAARSAHHIETHPEERRAQVRIGGETVADTQRALALTEGSLPTGEATHFAVGGEDAVAWSYEHPIEQVSQIRDLVAFYNERVEIQVG
jgi:uncharacterized protein (DUF427 family)